MQGSLGPTNTKEGILDFLESSGEAVAGGRSDFVSQRSNYQDAKLADFFQRPVEIYTLQWTASAFVPFHIDPWALYFNNAQVKAKLSTYSLMRTTLKVKITIDGTPFHYGRVVAGYEYSNSTAFVSANLSMCRLSQLPNVMLDPCMSQGGELTLPFVYPRDWAYIGDAYALRLGVIHFRVMNALEMINAAAPTSVRIKVYAWCDSDMELSGPTSTAIPTYVAQSEFTTGGPLSRPATAIANIAGMLVDAPIIGPFARATQIGASAFSRIAALFGYSMPRNIHTPTPVYKRVVGALHTLEGLDPCVTLSNDEKREMSIDPRIAGANFGDELSFASIAKRESYLNSVSWDTTSAPHTVLYTIPVTPMYYNSTIAATSTAYDPTAIGLVAFPFRFWTGTLEYHIQIVGSSLHRGRFRIVYSPDGAPYSSLVLNSMYSTIVDISETRDVCFNVGWSQAQAFGYTTPLSLSAISDPGLATNGLIYIVVENELVSILDSQGVYLNLYIKAGDDFQVRMPSEVTYPTSSETLFANGQSGTILPGTCQSTSVPLVIGNKGNRNMDLTYFGESVHSFRSLLKTRCFWRSIGAPMITSTTALEFEVALPAYPNGFLYGDYDRTSTGTNTAYNGFTYLAYLAPCFLAWKGSIRWKGFPSTPPLSTSSFNYIRVSTAIYSALTMIPTSVTPVDTAMVSSSQQALAILKQHARDRAGLALFQTFDNETLEFEMPDFGPNKYHLTLDKGGITNSLADLFNQPWLNIGATTASSSINSPRLHMYVYSGEDFNLIGFKGAAPFIIYDPGIFIPSTTLIDY